MQLESKCSANEDILFSSKVLFGSHSCAVTLLSKYCKGHPRNN